MEYDETFVCPKCKQDYAVIDFDIKSLKLNTYYVTFACVNNSCKNMNGDVVKTLSRLEIRNLLSEGYSNISHIWEKIYEPECKRSIEKMNRQIDKIMFPEINIDLDNIQSLINDIKEELKDIEDHDCTVEHIRNDIFKIEAEVDECVKNNYKDWRK